MKKLKHILKITAGWAGAILGSSLLCNETDALSNARLIESSVIEVRFLAAHKFCNILPKEKNII